MHLPAYESAIAFYILPLLRPVNQWKQRFVKFFGGDIEQIHTAQKMKFSTVLRISSVVVTKSTGNCEFGHIYSGVSAKFLMVGETNSVVGYYLMTEDHSIQLGFGGHCETTLDFFDFY